MAAPESRPCWRHELGGLNLFDDASILVETIDLSTGVNEFSQTWRGRILDFGQSRQHVEMLRQEMVEREPPPGLSIDVIERAILEVSAFLATFDVDADSGVATYSGQRRFGRVSAEVSAQQDEVGPRAPWRLIQEAFQSVSIARVSVPGSGGMETYSVSPLKWSPRYAMIIEIDPDKVADNIANPSERKARIEQSLEFEQSLPSEEGKVMIGEIQ